MYLPKTASLPSFDRVRRATRMPLCVATAFVLLASVWSVPRAEDVVPEKGPNDMRDYRYVTLSNRLRVLLVSDPTTDKAAAALDIDIGSRHDPDERLGLSHFLEHMLFLGTGKFPEAGEYQKYISKHGGSNNASTSFEHTNYFFQIDKAYLYGALDRFSQFFIAPLFDEEYVDRERNAVHSEYQARLKSDRSRSWEAMRQAMNPAHPLSRFSVGSSDTLANKDGDLRKALIDFWHAHYSANRMTLVIYGSESLDTLGKWAAELFSPIEDRDISRVPVDIPLFADSRLPALLEIEPLRDIRSLSLTFPVPSARPHFREKPTSYLANLLGHEGKGSLLSRLKEKGWSDGLSAGLGFQSQDDAFFGVNIKLTETGLANVPDIIGHVFEAVALIRDEGFTTWRRREQARALELAFIFQEQSSPMNYAVSLAGLMHVYPPKELLKGPYTMGEDAASLVEQYVDLLTPENMLVRVQAKGVKTDAVGVRYDVPYKISPIPPTWKAAWSRTMTGEATEASISLPAPNEFLPAALELKDGSQTENAPTVVPAGASTDEPIGAQVTLVHRLDTTFAVPKANVYVSVRSPVANDSPRHRVLTEMYLRLVRDQLQEFSYPASLAGLDYQVYPHLRGFTYRVSGYDDKVDVLLKRLTEALRRPVIRADRFDIELDDLVRNLANQAKDRSFRVAMRETSRLLLEGSWSEEDKLTAAREISVDELKAFVPRLFAKAQAVVLAHGNITLSEAKAASATVATGLLDASEVTMVPRGNVVKLAEGSRARIVVPVEHQDSGIALYFQGRSRLTLERARFALLRQIIGSPFYYELRTRQQLGYVVFATGMGMLEVPGLAFVIQSPSASPEVLDDRIRVFLKAFAQTLAGMSEDEFARHKAGLLSQILEKDKSLGERSGRYWREIDRRRFSFDSHTRLADAVKKIDKAEFVAFYEHMILGDGARQIESWAVGKTHAEAFTAAKSDVPAPGAAELVRAYREFQAGKPRFTSK